LALNCTETLSDKVPRGCSGFLVNDDLQKGLIWNESQRWTTNKVHRLRDQSTRHSNIDSCLLAIPSEYPDLDTSHLESMNRIWNSFLQLVFNCRRTEEEHFLLNDFSRLIQRVAATIDRLRRLIIDRGPFLVLLLWYIPVGEAECSQSISSIFLESSGSVGPSSSCRSTNLEVDHSGIRIRLVGTESLEYNGISTLAVQLDFSIWTSDNCRHALPGRIELADVKDLEFLIYSVDFDEN